MFECWRERVGRQIGPGEWCDDPPAVGELKDEPRGILPPEVIHHSGEHAADCSAVRFEDTDPRAPNVEWVWVMLHCF